MQKKITLAIMISIGITMAVSCNETGSNNGMSTKQDSLNFAKAVMDKYPQGQPAARTMMRANDSTIAPPEILWDSVVQYRDRYDKNPFLKGEADKVLKGFTINANEYSLITSNPEIHSLFLAFGLNGEGKETILVLGLDADGKFISDDSKHANYDYNNPCPDMCP